MTNLFVKPIISDPMQLACVTGVRRFVVDLIEDVAAHAQSEGFALHFGNHELYAAVWYAACRTLSVMVAKVVLN